MKSKITTILLFFIFSCFLFSSHIYAHDIDKSLVKNHIQKNKQANTSNINFKIAGKKSSYLRYNPLSLLAGSALYIYQVVITKHYASQCIHLPSCSEYAKQIIQKKGLIAGMGFTADRLSRCNHKAAKDVPWFNFKDEKIIDKP